MDRRAFIDLADRNLAALDDWLSGWGPFEPDPTLELATEEMSAILDRLTERLNENYPYPHPRYAGQMLKPPHQIAMLAYAATMVINPNNHALDGGMATSRIEKEVVADLAAMFGYGADHLGHLTSSGTIANLEALWIARCLHPEKAIVYSDQAHYTHGRMCGLLGAPCLTVPTDEDGKIDLDELQGYLQSGAVGTVVTTAGTTGLGVIDPIHEIRKMTARAGVRLHVDAAYGGFFTLLARRDEPAVDPAPFLAIAEADSVVVDPHKHGLQPYGCGAILFRDPSVGQFYKHDSPYTYFTSDELHLGEISLECSRAGAAAAALWATLQAFPLDPDQGLGAILARCREAALAWAAKIERHERLRLVLEPDLDIVTFFAAPESGDHPRASEFSALSEHVFRTTMEDQGEPVYLATLTVTRELLSGREPDIIWDEPTMTVLRSVLMKPEHASWVDRIHAAVERSL